MDREASLEEPDAPRLCCDYSNVDADSKMKMRKGPSQPSCRLSFADASLVCSPDSPDCWPPLEETSEGIAMEHGAGGLDLPNAVLHFANEPAVAQLLAVQRKM